MDNDCREKNIAKSLFHSWIILTAQWTCRLRILFQIMTNSQCFNPFSPKILFVFLSFVFMKTSWRLIGNKFLWMSQKIYCHHLAYYNWVFLSPVHNALKLSQVFGQISANSSKITLPTGKEKKLHLIDLIHKDNSILHVSLNNFFKSFKIMHWKYHWLTMKTLAKFSSR